MSKKIIKPNPPEHLVIPDTNILWHDDKSHVVNPDFEVFWADNSPTFPMKLIIPSVVRGELLYQQTTSALKLLSKVNIGLEDITSITQKPYSHRVTEQRIQKEVEGRFDLWIQGKQAEIYATPVNEIDWTKVIDDSIWRQLPFTPDAKNPKNEKGFRDYMILETLCSACKFYSDDVNIAFICGDYALRRAAEERLGSIDSFSCYESLEGFRSFIELTRKNLTERFVKSIMSRAAIKFHNEKERGGLIYIDGFYERLRAEFKDDIENPKHDDPFLGLMSPSTGSWKNIGNEQAWVTRPQFLSLEGSSEYHWTSKVTYARLYERDNARLASLPTEGERRLLILSIDVHWKANVRADGRFFECNIVNYKKINYTFEPPTDEQLDRYGLNKKAEQAP